MSTSTKPDAPAPLGASGPPETVYWRKTRQLTLGLLGAWFAVTFLSAFFARDIDVVLFGWPFSFWFAAQGALLLFVLIVAIYAWRMERLDDEAGSAD